MSDENREFRPGPRSRTVKDADGTVIHVPDGWDLLPPGDAGVTRRLKALGPTWAMKEKVGRKLFSKGVWAPAENIRAAQEAMETQRADPEHQRKLEAGRRRREREQENYVAAFTVAVRRFLAFDPRHRAMEKVLAQRIAEHATPVGSGTVARTETIPVEQRAEAAVIAWMRHQTTAYDNMYIERVKGKRREVRRQLAEQSRRVLQRYRDGEPAVPACPLAVALGAAEAPPPPPTGPRGCSDVAPTSDHEARQKALYEQVRARMAARGRKR